MHALRCCSRYGPRTKAIATILTEAIATIMHNRHPTLGLLWPVQEGTVFDHECNTGVP